MFERRLPREMQGREASLASWTEAGLAPERVQAVLQILAKAFRWKNADTLLLRPEDRLWSIYRSYYPQERWSQRWTPDELETETLARDLKKEAPVGSAIDLDADLTLEDLVRYVGGAA